MEKDAIWILNRPRLFSEVMNRLLGKILYKHGIVYLDDIILWADTLEEMDGLI